MDVHVHCRSTCYPLITKHLAVIRNQYGTCTVCVMKSAICHWVHVFHVHLQYILFPPPPYKCMYFLFYFFRGGGGRISGLFLFSIIFICFILLVSYAIWFLERSNILLPFVSAVLTQWTNLWQTGMWRVKVFQLRALTCLCHTILVYPIR